ncbi:MAG: transcriptional repressor LexA [Spirochaetales bacterium]|nr:transcriptional repressor LexA [Spirochaetales bacterium]
MKDLTNRQQEILSYLESYIGDHKYPPTMREIAANFGISAKGAHDHIKALEKKNRIKCDINRSRAIEILGNDPRPDLRELNIEIPILGNVAAGVPLFAEENFDGYIQVSADSLRTGTHFALRVKGDSMQDAGILDGDLGIFLQRNIAENGDIVVAMLNEESVTLKRFFKEKNRIKLKAENPVYPPIYTQNIRILGKLQRIIRYYE